MSRLARVAVVAHAVLVAAALCRAQQRLNVVGDDPNRIESLENAGSRLEGAHIILYFPESLTRVEASALLKRLDPAVGGLWAKVGLHEWQVVPKGKIRYYLHDDRFVAHATHRSAVLIPMARVKDGRAPFLHEAAHEVLASKHSTWTANGGWPAAQYPLWFTEGLADYVSRVVGREFGIAEEGPFGTPTVEGVDGTCAERARTADGAKMFPLVGASEVPDVLSTTERGKFAPTYYACSFSLVKDLAENAGLKTLIGLLAAPPAESVERLDNVMGRPLVQVVAEWHKRLGQ